MAGAWQQLPYFFKECLNLTLTIEILRQGIWYALAGEASEEVFQLGLGGVWLVHCHCNGFVRSTFENEGRFVLVEFCCKPKYSSVDDVFGGVAS